MRLRLFLLCTLFFTTLAFVPPKPGSHLEATYESVYHYRQRLNITYNYSPTLLHPEMCRFLNETTCERADRALQDHATAHQQIQKELYRQRRRTRRRELLKQHGGDDIEDHENGRTQAAVTNSTRGHDRHDSFSHDSQAHHQNNAHNDDASNDFLEQLGAFTRVYGNPHSQPSLQDELEELEQLLREFNTTREAYQRRLRSERSEAIHNPSLGTFVVPLLLMKFTDHNNRPLPERYHYQILWNLRIKKWIDENSYGKYDAFFDVQDWEKTDNTEEHYSFGQYGRLAEVQESFHPLLDSMDARLGGDWSIYDANNDGFLDNLIIIHSGYAAEEGGQDCTNGRTAEYRIWSHAFADSYGWVSSNGQYKTRGYMISAGLDLKCDYETAKMGVMTHEYLHTFFLIDLYDTNFVGKGLGNFCIMAYPYGRNNDGYIPMHLSAWAKKEIEWQRCTHIEASGEYTIAPAATTDACFHITLIDFTAFEEYILLENRQLLEFDINFFAPGLVMYHIDEAADDQKWTGYPGLDPYWPETGDHYRVAVIQADRSYDLEMAKNIGDQLDVWQPGQKLTPNDDGETYPSTDSYQDGFIEKTGITIEVLESEGMNVKVKVDFGERRGPSNEPQIFITPSKEEDQIHELAETQFTVPDDPDHRISGMIPQMPWYEEWKQENGEGDTDTTMSESTTVFVASSEEGVLQQTFSGGEASKKIGSLAKISAVFMTAAVLWM